MCQGADQRLGGQDAAVEGGVDGSVVGTGRHSSGLEHSDTGERRGIRLVPRHSHDAVAHGDAAVFGGEQIAPLKPFDQGLRPVGKHGVVRQRAAAVRSGRGGAAVLEGHERPERGVRAGVPVSTSKDVEAAAPREGSVEAPSDMDDVVVGDGEAASAHGSKLDLGSHDPINPLGGRQLALGNHVGPKAR